MLLRRISCSLFAFVLAACLFPAAALAAPSFPDVSTGAWYFSVVTEAAEKGYFNGHDDGRFRPNSSLTRAQVCRVIMNAEGVDESEFAYSGRFKDVPADTWYTAPVEWCASQGIVTGYDSTGKFKPNSNITRQDLCVILARYAGTKGIDVTHPSETCKYLANWNKVSSYARTQVGWCVDEAIIGGNGNINPLNNATRAEACKMVLYTMELVFPE